MVRPLCMRSHCGFIDTACIFSLQSRFAHDFHLSTLFENFCCACGFKDSHCFQICSRTCTKEQKVFQEKNVSVSAIFHKKFLLQQCLNPIPDPNSRLFFKIRIRIRSKLTNSFGLGSTTLHRMQIEIFEYLRRFEFIFENDLAP
jgi:hypothetical protein